MIKRLSKILVLVLVGALFLTACGKKDKAEEPEEVEGVEDVVEDADPELTEEEIKEEEERSQKVDTYARSLDLVDSIIEDFENVRLEDERIQFTDDNKSIYTADIYLFLDNDNEEEAVKLIDEYSEVFKEKFTAEEDYEELIIYWLTPNHDKSDAIEKIYY